MNPNAPESAPARTDLPWLRRRTIRTAAPVPTPTPSPAISPQTTAQTGADLDLSAGSHAPTTRPEQSGRPEWRHPTPSSSLDLSGRGPAPKVAPGAEPARQRPVHAARFPAARTRNGLPTILTTQAPVVTLTRVQSGVGALTFQAACSDLVGDLRLGCAYQLASGHSSVIHPAEGLRSAPAGSARPVIIAGSEPVESLTIDLGQSREVERMIIYAYSASGATLSWDGAILIQTYGGARIEVPLHRDPAPGVMVPLSLYNIDGEFVLRAERLLISGSIRQATAAFGFERISWLDDRTPIN